MDAATLKDNLTFVTQNLDSKDVLFLSKLVELDIISLDKKQELKECSTRQGCSDELLSCVLKAGPRGCDGLLQALEVDGGSLGNREIAKRLLQATQSKHKTGTGCPSETKQVRPQPAINPMSSKHDIETGAVSPLLAQMPSSKAEQRSPLRSSKGETLQLNSPMGKLRIQGSVKTPEKKSNIKSSKETIPNRDSSKKSADSLMQRPISILTGNPQEERSGSKRGANSKRSANPFATEMRNIEHLS